MALALYRTYRPGSLAEVIGQEHVTEPLARALESGRIHHAYLFSGPRGCGKTSTARIMARSLNCEQGPRAEPCGQCRSCIELAPNGPGSMDVVELDAATHRGIDDARDLREKAIYAPAASRFKIYIIDEAHQLTNEAANALLKLVEEPPPHLRFIFATTEPDKIIPTIRSRTFHYGFRLVPARTLAEHLGSVCRSEGVPAEAAALAIVARAGAGSVRDGLSVLGQLLAGAGPQGLTYADAVSALGLTDASLIDEFVAALSAGSAAEMFGIVDVVISAGHDPRRFVTDILDRLRDLIVLRADHEALSKGLIDVPDDEGQRMVAQAQSLGLAELSRAADLVSTGLGQIKGATAPRLQLELLCARLALPGPGGDLSAVLARLDRLERGGPAAPAVGPSVAAKPSSESRRPAGPSGPDAPAREVQVDPDPLAAPAQPTSPTAGPPARPATSSGGPAAPPRRPELRRDASDPAPARAGSDPVPPVVPVATPANAPEPPAERPATPAPAPASTASTAPATPAPAPVVEAPGDDTTITRIRDSWPAILERLASSSRVAWTVFHAATPVSCVNGALAVAVAEPGNVRAIAQRGHDERLRQAIIDVLALDLTIDVLHDPEPARPVPSGAGAPGDGATSAAGARPASRATGAGAATEAATGATGSPRAASPASRPADVVREAGSAPGAPDVADEPSPDDPDLDPGGAQGLALITRELGARPIGEIDHS